MKQIKKIVAVVLVCVCMVACVLPMTEVNGASGYAFKSKGVTVAPGQDAKAFIKANKSYYMSMKNAKSCVASSGYDVTRVYKFFTLVTYSKSRNGEGKVESIMITNPKVTNPEGAHCGMSVDELKRTYKNCKKLGSTYYIMKGKTKLSFYVEDGEVAEINYLYTGAF